MVQMYAEDRGHGGGAPRPKAENVAAVLSYEFLGRGLYAAASGTLEVPGLVKSVASLAAFNDDAIEAFGSISVQSVGYEPEQSDPKVHLYLTKGNKRSIRQLPQEINGVPISVHVMGPVNVRPEQAMAATNQGHVFERGGRIACGSSCGPTSESSTGTIGAIVRKKGAEDLFLLSNNHVLAGCNHVPKDQPILAPSSADGRPNIRAPGEVARHAMIHELRSGNPNFVNPCTADLALGKVTQPNLVSSWQGDAGLGYDTPTAAVNPLPFMKVKKFGRSSGLRFGEVEAYVNTPTPIEYKSKHFNAVVWFTDIWTVRANEDVFAIAGDSGSLVVTEDGTSAVGLVFAANRSGEYAWIIPMPSILEAFGGLELVTGHGV